MGQLEQELCEVLLKAPHSGLYCLDLRLWVRVLVLYLRIGHSVPRRQKRSTGSVVVL